MKIKQIGNFSSGKEPDKSNSDDVNNEFDKVIIPTTHEQAQGRSRSTLFIVFGIGLAAIIVILLVFALNGKDEDTRSTQSTSDSLKLKELYLKERELRLKESELNNTSNTGDIEHIKNIVQSLINEFNAKSTAIGRYYGSSVNYYAWGPTDKAKVINDKKAFYSRWDYLNMYIDNIQVQKESDNIFRCDYDKTLESSNYTNGKNLKLKVKSVLLFEKVKNEWLITEERDEKTYYLNKNY